MKKTVLSMSRALAVSVLGAFIMLCGCQGLSDKTAKSPTVMVARYTAAPVTVDGVLDEPIWAEAEVYTLSLSADKQAKDQTVQEPGYARLAWDNDYFYLAISYEDSDLVAQGDSDQLHHYKFGDLAELFLKPVDSTWYWELYVTPKSHKTSLWFPGRGHLGLPECDNYSCDMRVAAQCQGTLNDWRDKDQSWTAELAMPIKDLTAFGDSFGPGHPWRILVARYNYSRYLSNAELSMSPSLSATSYHLHEEYADLVLEK